MRMFRRHKLFVVALLLFVEAVVLWSVPLLFPERAGDGSAFLFYHRYLTKWVRLVLYVVFALYLIKEAKDQHSTNVAGFLKTDIAMAVLTVFIATFAQDNYSLCMKYEIVPYLLRTLVCWSIAGCINYGSNVKSYNFMRSAYVILALKSLVTVLVSFVLLSKYSDAELENGVSLSFYTLAYVLRPAYILSMLMMVIATRPVWHDKNSYRNNQ